MKTHRARSPFIQVLRFLLIASLLSACEGLKNDIIYSRFERVSDRIWTDTEEFFYSVPITDTETKYEITGIIRYLPDFALVSLPIGIVEEGASSLTSRYATSVLQVQTPSGFGSKVSDRYLIREARFVIEEVKKFPAQGIYTYSLRQLSEADSIPGVAEVGVIIRKL